MKRMSPEEAAEWRRKSVERYRAKRHGVPTLCSAGTFIRDDLHEAVECVLRARHLGEHKGETSSGAVWWTDEHLEWDPFHSNYRSAAPSRQKPVTPQRARKQAEDAEYAVERQKRFVRARGRCEVCTHPVGEDWQSHHKVRRSHRVDHSADNLLVVHPSCHLRVHTEIAWAREQGFISTAWRQME